MIVPVRLQQTDHKENQVLVYALLDPQSDACFISDSVRDQIHADGEEVHLELSTMAGKTLMTCSTLKNLVVRSPNDDTPINLPATYSRCEIPAERSLIPRPETARKWPHLQDIAEEMSPKMDDVEIGLLIGTSCGRASSREKCDLATKMTRGR